MIEFENEQVRVARRMLAQVRKGDEYARAADAEAKERAKSPVAREAVRDGRERNRQRRVVRDDDAQLELLGGDRRVHEGIAMPSRPGASGEATSDVGAEAEERAVRFLSERGYWVIERNYKCEIGELDIVARHGDDLVFVEVRSRESDEHGDAVDTVGPRKQQKISRVAEVYLMHKQPAFERCRFDVVAIDDDQISVYEDAWRLGGLL